VPPVDWDGACGADRSCSFHLHAWDGLGPILAAYDRTREPRYLHFAAALAADWARAHPTLDVASPFAWYDMAVALRAYRLAYVVDALRRAGRPDDAELDVLLASVEQHRLALADEERFAAHSNHGYFQAAGQLAMGRRLPELPGMPEAAEQGLERLRRLLAEHFAADGVHREHSPGYHHAVLVTLEQLIAAGLVADEDLVATCRRIEAALAWFVMPDGTLAPFGDTDAGFRPPPPPDDADAHLRSVLTAGREGSAPGELVKGFPEGGYAVCRRLGGSYLAQMCAFHSRTHKHADTLGVVWQEGGRDLLVDAGRYDYLGRTDPESELALEGFWYSDPNRVYVESTRAHNTVEVDGRSQPRRRTKPFGSALGRHGEADGIAYVESAFRRPGGVDHTRVLVYEPGAWLLVLDTLIDPRDQPHDFVQRFNFGPELALEALGDGFGLRIPGEARRLYVLPLLESTPIAPVRGQVEPEPLGWACRSARTMTPVWTAGFEAAGAARTRFATLLALADARPVADHEGNRMNVTGRRARLSWRTPSEGVTIELDREGAELALACRRAPA
jgi:hypothetical protein